MKSVLAVVALLLGTSAPAAGVKAQSGRVYTLVRQAVGKLQDGRTEPLPCTGGRGVRHGQRLHHPLVHEAGAFGFVSSGRTSIPGTDHPAWRVTLAR